MIREVYKKNSPLAEELVNRWGEKHAEFERLSNEMREIKERMINELSPYKVGDVIRTIDDGKEYVVSEIKVSDYHLISGCYNTEPYISFQYTTKVIRKDGMPSQNNYHIMYDTKIESTGRHFNFVTDQFE